jgi:hypothetical protein
LLSDTVVLTFSSTSNYQKVVLPDASTKQRLTLYGNDQDSFFDISQFLIDNAVSLRAPNLRYSGAYLTMLASESLLRRDWEQPEEDRAWANL